jgi:DNA-3-methyladenine glycosylase
VTLESVLHQLGRDVRAGAAALLGVHLVRGPLRARIVETEAYRGDDDPGSHAWRGVTPRNRVMFGAAGRAYVYFIYGNYWMLNVTAQDHGVGAAVLIRAAQPLEGLDSIRLRRPAARSDRDLLNGPAKLCAAFGITGQENGASLFYSGAELRLEPGEPVSRIVHGPRIGLAAGKGEHHEWRFADAEALEWVSRPVQDLRPLACRPEDVDPAPVTPR